MGNARKSRHYATPPEKVEQQHEYMKYVQWAKSIGITEQEFRTHLESAPKEQHLRGKESLPNMLRDKKLTTKEHAVQATRAMAYERMAAVAGNDIGGEAMAAEASKYMLQLLEAEKYFLRQERGAVPPTLGAWP